MSWLPWDFLVPLPAIGREDQLDWPTLNNGWNLMDFRGSWCVCVFFLVCWPGGCLEWKDCWGLESNCAYATSSLSCIHGGTEENEIRGDLSRALLGLDWTRVTPLLRSTLWCSRVMKQQYFSDNIASTYKHPAALFQVTCTLLGRDGSDIPLLAQVKKIFIASVGQSWFILSWMLFFSEEFCPIISE